MNILGINAYHGDVAACLVSDGELVSAVEEERYRRVKHCAGFPEAAIHACLQAGGLTAQEIDHFAISRNPRANIARKLMFGLRKMPGRALIADRLRNTARVRTIGERLAHTLGVEPHRVKRKMRWVEHHPAHLSSAFFVSPFDRAAVCAIDGFGDFVSTSVAVGEGHELRYVDRVYFPHSLGLFYLAITQYLGFPKYGDEYKVMGLAPYGRPDFAKDLRRLVTLKAKGRFELKLPYFRHWSEGVSMTWDDGEPTLGPVFTEKLEELLGPARKVSDPLEPRHEAIAASLQVVFEEALFHVLNELHRTTKETRLCLAGGCAMNSVANGKIRNNTPFENIFIQPAAGDNGTALGAAFYVWNKLLRGERRFLMEHGYWGAEFDDRAIEAVLERAKGDIAGIGCRIDKKGDSTALVRETAGLLTDGKIVGWFQGRMEWGARALGNRSIVADPRRPDMRDLINSKIKFREAFRPFAPAVLEEAVDDYFVGAVPDPFMIQVYPVRPDKRSVIPAVTHVDGSGRLQTVSRGTNPLFWSLIKVFEELTGVPVLLNTSFNESEPIVHTPAEALSCFLRTKMDVLVLGNYVLRK